MCVCVSVLSQGCKIYAIIENKVCTKTLSFYDAAKQMFLFPSDWPDGANPPMLLLHSVTFSH